MIEGLGKLGYFLLTHPELVASLMDLIDRGATKEEITDALRNIKIAASDQAMNDELGL